MAQDSKNLAWLRAATDAGFRLIPILPDKNRKGGDGHNFAPPAGWNDRSNAKWKASDLTPAAAEARTTAGGNVGIGVWTGGLIVDADNKAACRKVEDDLLRGARTLTSRSPRGKQYLFLDDCAGLIGSGNTRLGPGIELRVAEKNYGMAVGSRRTEASYSKSKLEAARNLGSLEGKGPWFYEPDGEVVPVISVPAETRRLLEQANRPVTGREEPSGDDVEGRRRDHRDRPESAERGVAVVVRDYGFGDRSLADVAAAFGKAAGAAFEKRENGGVEQWNGPCPAGDEAGEHGATRFAIKGYQEKDGAATVGGRFTFTCRACCPPDGKRLGMAVDEVMGSNGKVAEGAAWEWAQRLADSALFEGEVIRAFGVVIRRVRKLLRVFVNGHDGPKAVAGSADLSAKFRLDDADIVATAKEALKQSSREDRFAWLFRHHKADPKKDLASRFSRLGIRLRWNLLLNGPEVRMAGGGWNDDAEYSRLPLLNRAMGECLTAPTVELKFDRREKDPVPAVSMSAPSAVQIGQERFNLGYESLAKDDPFDPVLFYLENLQKWDGTPRMDSLLTRCFKVEDEYSEAARYAVRNTLVAVILRSRERNVKHDEMPILIGDEGTAKSTFWAALVPDPALFSDCLDFMSPTKELAESISGHVIVEASELIGLNRIEISRVYSILSRNAEKVRMAYGRYARRMARRCVIVGSTNDETSLPVLPEGTGRRFVPVKVVGRGATLDANRRHVFDLVTAERDQLWAEALHAADNGDRGYIPGSAEEHISRAVRKHMRADELVGDQVDRYLASYTTAQNRYEGHRIGDICKEVNPQNPSAAAARVISELKRRGFTRSTKWDKGLGKAVKVWMQTRISPDDEPGPGPDTATAEDANPEKTGCSADDCFRPAVWSSPAVPGGSRRVPLCGEHAIEKDRRIGEGPKPEVAEKRPSAAPESKAEPPVAEGDTAADISEPTIPDEPENTGGNVDTERDTEPDYMKWKPV